MFPGQSKAGRGTGTDRHCSAVGLIAGSECHTYTYSTARRTYPERRHEPRTYDHSTAILNRPRTRVRAHCQNPGGLTQVRAHNCLAQPAGVQRLLSML